jgi:Uma2 family endonuclease
MTAVTTVYARGPVSIAEWEALPDDGNRYELIDGTVYVNAAPKVPHQAVVAELMFLLHPLCPEGVMVLPGPVDFQADAATILEPDLLVIPRSEAGGARLHVPPLLVVEVASPSTRRYDRVTKLAAYDRAGVPAYWIVDGDEPSLLVFEREGDRLVERAYVRGDESYAATIPFPVTVGPSALAR